MEIINEFNYLLLLIKVFKSRAIVYDYLMIG